MNKNMSLTNSGRTNVATGEVKNNDAIGTPPPPPPPRIKSKQVKEIVTSAEGRQFKNGIELFDENSINKELEKSTNKKFQPRPKELYAAVAENDITTTKKLIENNPDLVATFPTHGPNLFLFALEKGYLRLAELLFKGGAIQHLDQIETTEILNRIILQGHLEIAKLLVIEGANLNPGADSPYNPLRAALDQGYFEFANFLITHGSDVDYKLDNGCTLLFNECIKNPNPKIVEFLIANGANTGVQNDNGQTALMYAAHRNNIEITEILLKNTKNINAENHSDGTALIYAAQQGYSKIVSLLIEAEASIDQLNNRRNSALSYACFGNHAETLDLLIDGLGGIDFNDINFSLHYPLHEIIQRGNSEVLSVLLKRGLSLDALDQNIWKYIEHASDNGHTEVIRILLENFSSSLPLSKPGPLSRTPALVFEHLHGALRLAARGGNEEIVRMLISAGAKPDVRNTDGESAISFAIKNEHLGTMLLLTQAAGKLTYRKENGKVSDELLWALDRPEPDSLIIDVLLNFENEIAIKQGSLTYTVRFNELCNNVHNLIAASRKGKLDQDILRDLNASLCADFDLSYLNADTVANIIQRVSTIYSPNTSSGAPPTAKQLRMSFVESIAGDQRLHDLIRHDDHPAETHYENYDKAPEIAEKLIRRASGQAGFIVLSAETELKEQQDTLSGFLKNRAPTVTSNQVREFMQEEGWHPLLISVVVDSRDGLKQNRTSDRLFEAIRKNLDAAEFVEKIEQLPSDAARHLLTQQMSRLMATINA